MVPWSDCSHAAIRPQQVLYQLHLRRFSLHCRVDITIDQYASAALISSLPHYLGSLQRYFHGPIAVMSPPALESCRPSCCCSSASGRAASWGCGLAGSELHLPVTHRRAPPAQCDSGPVTSSSIHRYAAEPHHLTVYGLCCPLDLAAGRSITPGSFHRPIFRTGWLGSLSATGEHASDRASHHPSSCRTSVCSMRQSHFSTHDQTFD